MIEVNLLPGGKKRTAGGSPFAGLAQAFKSRGGGKGGGGGPTADPYMVFAVVAASIAIGYTAWSYMGTTGAHEELAVQIEEARRDSVRFADLIERTNLLAARNDSIAQRVAIIQDIDQGRYVWPHILDEVAAAVPDYTWLTEVLYAGGDPVQVRISGRAGSIYAITNFMRRLEASPFLRAVRMDRAEQAPSDVNQADLVYVFELITTYDAPPFDELQTVPLLTGGTLSTQAAIPAATGER